MPYGGVPQKNSWLIFPEAFAVQKMDPPGVLQVFWAILIHQLTEAPRLRCQRCIRCETLLQLTDTILTGRCWTNGSRQLRCNSASVQQFLEYRKHPENQHKNPTMSFGRWHISFLKNAFRDSGSCWFSGEDYCPMFSVHMKTHDKSWHLEVAPDVVGSRWHTTSCQQFNYILKNSPQTAIS